MVVSFESSRSPTDRVELTTRVPLPLLAFTHFLDGDSSPAYSRGELAGALRDADRLLEDLRQGVADGVPGSGDLRANTALELLIARARESKEFLELMNAEPNVSFAAETLMCNCHERGFFLGLALAYRFFVEGLAERPYPDGTSAIRVADRRP